jgi:hypothetical protein
VSGTARVSTSLNINTASSGYTTPSLLVNAGAGVAIPLQAIADSTGGRLFRFYTSDFNNITTGTSIRLNFGAATGNTSANLQVYTGGEQVVAGTILALQPSGGNVGIGTSTPFNVANFTALEVKGVNSGLVYVTNSSTQAGHLYVNSSGINVGSSSNDAVIFNSNNTERMRITSGGNLQIGGTTATDAKLFARGSSTTSSNFAILLYNSTPTDLFFVRNDGLTNFGVVTNSPYNYNVTSNPRTAGLDASGGFGYITSTRESKGNIKTMQNIDFINHLNPVSFNYRKKDSDKNKFIDELYEDVYYGFIADEVEKVDKNLVFYDDLKDGNKKLSGVHYNSIIAILTKAIQELSAEITILKNK